MKLFAQYSLIPALLLAASTASAHTAAEVRARVDATPYGDVQSNQCVQVPRITWGGELATFYANGTDHRTTSGSYFNELGICVNLVPGDDVVKQAIDFKSGKSPFMRVTYRTASVLTEMLCKDPRTCPVVLFQMTYSVGDHLVSRKHVATPADYANTSWCVQIPGPHMGLVQDSLENVGKKWNDVKILDTDDLTISADSPANKFRAGKQCDVAAVITPDMVALVGDGVGTGALETVAGAHVVDSTAQASRSIADVYLVRKDWYDTNSNFIHRFAAGYFRASEWLKGNANARNKEYSKLIRFAASKAVFDLPDGNPTEADGLFQDCNLVGAPGSKLFMDETNTRKPGFTQFNRKGMDLAVASGFATTRVPLLKGALDWTKIHKLGRLKLTGVRTTPRFNAETVGDELAALEAGGSTDAQKYSFTIQMQPNATDFDPSHYATDLDKTIQMAGTYGNAIIEIRGHADSYKAVGHMLMRCLSKGDIRKTGSTGNWRYTFRDGTELIPTNTDKIVELIKAGACGAREERSNDKYRPVAVMRAARSLSQKRAQQARAALIRYAASKGVKLDPSQIVPTGYGMRDPIVPFHGGNSDADRAMRAKNFRVEIALIAVSAEALTTDESGWDL